MKGDDRVCLRRGSEDDLNLIVDLSRQRGQEQHQDTDVEHIRTKLLAMMRSDFTIFLFEAGGSVIGYSLVSKRTNPLSILEYFLLPGERGKGYGYEAIMKMLDATHSTLIDVSPDAWREAAGAM